MNDQAKQPPGPGLEEHVLGADGQFHVADEPVDLSIYGWEDWLSFVLFWLLALVVFYQVFTRYALNDPAGWTEEIARYMLVTVVFIGASMSVRKNNHIQVDVFYRFMAPPLARACSTAVDLVRCAFLGYAAWLTWLLIGKIGEQRMAIVDLPMVMVFGPMMFGFAVMFWRSLQVGVRHWRSGYSVLERPEVALEGGEK